MLTGLRILVVDDMDIVGEILAEVLCEEGAEIVGPAVSVSDALDAVAAHAIDGAFLDINLGHEFCWPVAERLRAGGVPFVLLTGSSEEADVPPAWRSTPRLLKPVPHRVLVAAASERFRRVHA